MCNLKLIRNFTIFLCEQNVNEIDSQLPHFDNNIRPMYLHAATFLSAFISFFSAESFLFRSYFNI